MKILGLDTSTATGGAALIDGERLIAEYTLSLQRTTHSERLLPAVQQVLHAAQRSDGVRPVDGIAVALGPGSFTGLRIGVVTAKTLAYSWDVPVVGVSTLQALAYQAGGGASVVCALMDARNGNVYGAAYEAKGGAPVELVPPGLRDAAEWLPALRDALDEAEAGDVLFTGDGVGLYWDDIRGSFGEQAGRVGVGFDQLRSGAVAALGRERLLAGDGDDPMQLVPLYLRKSEAERKWAQRGNKQSHS